jgi:N-terminal acetyltransferase B complex non-catalytic subunit
LTTCPLAQEYIAVTAEAGDAQLKCKFCSSITTKNCISCLENIVSSALSAYKEIDKTPEAPKGLDKDPHVDLALVAASTLLKLSGLRQSASSPSRLAPLSSAADPSRVLQAAMLLAAQLSKTPDEMPLRLLLVQVYVLLGCGSLAHATWVPTDVKRTIQDALSPLFFDRLSGVSPGLFQRPGPGRQALTSPLTSYYSGCLREKSPVKIWDAFAAGSYTSILDMATYSDRLRRSCTLVMTVVEERRATRALGGKIEGGIEQSPLLGELMLLYTLSIPGE